MTVAHQWDRRLDTVEELTLSVKMCGTPYSARLYIPRLCLHTRAEQGLLCAEYLMKREIHLLSIKQGRVWGRSGSRKK